MSAEWSLGEWEAVGRARLARRCAWLAVRLGADRVTVWGYEPTSQTVTPVAGSHEDEHTVRVALEWVDTPLADLPMFERVLACHRSELAVHDARADGGWQAEMATTFGTASMRLVRLFAGRPVGVLVVEPCTARLPGRSSVSSLSGTLAGLVAARAAIRQRADHEFMMSLMCDGAGQPTVGEALGIVCERLSRRVHGQRASVFLVEDGTLRPRMSRFADGKRDAAAWRRMQSATEPLPLIELVLQSGGPVAMERPDPALMSGWWRETFGMTSAFGVPVGKPGTPLGVLMVDAARPRPFSDRDLAMAGAVGAQLALLMGVVETRQRYEADLRASRAVRHLLRQGAAAGSVHETGEVLARVAMEALGAEVAATYFADAAGVIDDVVTISVPTRTDRLLRQRITGTVVGDTSAWRVGAQAEINAVDDVTRYRGRPTGVIQTLELRSFIAIPLMSRDGVLGRVLCGMTTAPRRWTSAQRDLASQLLIEGSLLVDWARLREREQVHLVALSEQASHDALTGLANRSALFSRLHEAVAGGQRAGRNAGLLLVDLNDFKQVNDTFGHPQGDLLLTAVAARMSATLRDDDLLARIGGDEFGVLPAGPGTRGRVTALANRLHRALAEPLVVAGVPLQVHASIGIALFPDHGADAESLLQHADIALYHAKREQVRTVVYRGEDYEPEGRRLLLLGRLPTAVRGGELELHYQPIHRLDGGGVVAVEALVRWQHPEYGLLSPAEFVPFAETTELIHELTDWVVETAVAQHASWQREGLPVRMCVNVSARDLQHPRLAETVAAGLRRHRVAPSDLTIEVTETAALSYADVSSGQLDRLRELGVRIAIDDFGAGNTSLAHLARLALDEIKVDASLIRQLTDSARSRRVLAALVGLSEQLGLDVTAEGIETEATAELVRRSGCDLAQGYHFARPQPAERLRALLVASSGPQRRVTVRALPGRRPSPAGQAPVRAAGRSSAS